MSVALVTGSAGLVGSESVAFLCDQGFTVVGIDNDMRKAFFGPDASTAWNSKRLGDQWPARYRYHDADIRDADAMGRIFRHYGRELELVIHAAAQPSHDWAARDPQLDFSINAGGTLVLLENLRAHCPDAAFIFCSTNKVYGDRPNQLPLIERETRWEIDSNHPYRDGIDETMSIDQSKHSLFGASKVAADVLVQEYGRYFGCKTAAFRGGCLTGPSHSGTELHGFLSYLVKCAMTGTPYRVYGYGGKQVRDNIHSRDLVQAFFQFFKSPRAGEVYNIGGGRFSNCSMLEAIALAERTVGQRLQWSYEPANREGDHIWWISGLGKFQAHYPEWRLTYSVPAIVREIYEANRDRWTHPDSAGSKAGG
jgi:CDP-paratose 2-epimerase